MLVKAFSLLLLLGFIWGSGYSIARYALTHGVSPLGYAMWQSLGPAMILSFLTLKQGSTQLKPLLKFWHYYLATAILGIVIPNTNMYFIAPHLPASVVAVIVNIVPLLVYPLAILAKQERFDSWRITGVIMGVAGVMLIVAPGMSLGHDLTTISWALLTLITPFSFALCVVFISRYRPTAINSLVLSAGMLLFAALLLAPIVYKSGQFYRLSYPFNLAEAVIVLEIILSTIGYIILFKLIKLAGPVYYSLVSGVVCLTGLFWGCVLFSERINLPMAIAVVLIVSAIALVTTKPKAYVAFAKARPKSIN